MQAKNYDLALLAFHQAFTLFDTVKVKANTKLTKAIINGRIDECRRLTKGRNRV